jgi:UDP-glucose 4-epimerase
MKFLLTGDMGFLGKRVKAALEAEGHEVAGFDYARGQNILDTEALAKSFKESACETVIHLAAVADLNFFREDAEGCRRINVEGTRNVLKCCEQFGARLVFAGTCCSYGNNGCHPTDEESPLAPTEPYAVSKMDSEVDIKKAGGSHCIMRLATFYGPGMRGALCPAVFLDLAHRGKTLNIHGDGKQTRTFTFVDDIVSGVFTIATSEPKYDVVNVTTTESVSVLQIAALAKEVTGNDVPIEHIKDREGQILKEEILNHRLKSLGWEPKTDFATGMRLSYEDYTKNGGWLQSAGVSGGKAAE